MGLIQLYECTYIIELYWSTTIGVYGERRPKWSSPPLLFKTKEHSLKFQRGQKGSMRSYLSILYTMVLLGSKVVTYF